MHRQRNAQAGFTLIELLVVVVVIGILAAVAVPNLMGAQDKAKNSGVQSSAHTVQMALEAYAADNNGNFPDHLQGFSGLGSGYLSSDSLPATPWGTQQASNSPIPVPATKTVAARLGTGLKAPPSTWTHFGSLAYTRSGAQNEGYELVGTGKKGENAVVASYIKNF